MGFWFFRCCGGDTIFVLVPFVGYTRLQEVAVAVTLVLLVLTSLVFLFTRSLVKGRGIGRGGFAVALFLCIFSVGLGRSKSYFLYALKSLDASVIYPQARLGGRLFCVGGGGGGGAPRIRPASVKVLEREEVNEVADLVLSKWDKFLHIDHLAYGLPFFTYGPYWGYHEFGRNFNHRVGTERPRHETKLSSTYTTYQDALDLTRDEMKEELGWFYDRVVESLKEVLGAERVHFLPGNVGLPGFHIIPSHLAWTFPIFRFHSDETFDLIVDYVLGAKGATELNPDSCVGESRISFTLPIAMPDERSGLNYVDFSTDEKGTDCRREAEKEYGGGNEWKCHLKTREIYR